MNILVVEDNTAQRLVMEKSLKYCQSVNVFSAASFEEAKAILEDCDIDGAFLDLVLYHSSGLEVAHYCKQLSIPVVFCTASDDPHNMNLMYEYGLVIKKPCCLNALCRCLEYFKAFTEASELKL